MMPNGDPRDGFRFPTLTLMIRIWKVLLSQEPNCKHYHVWYHFKSHLSSIWHKFQENVIMLTVKIVLIIYIYRLYTGKSKISMENINFYLLKGAEH